MGICWKANRMSIPCPVRPGSGIPQRAEVDGAGFWRRMFEITIPLTMPVIAVAALFGAIFTFTDMTVVYILTRGGPTNSTRVLASWAFFRGIEGGDVAQGAAIAVPVPAVAVPAAAGRRHRHPSSGTPDGSRRAPPPSAGRGAQGCEHSQMLGWALGWLSWVGCDGSRPGG